MEDLKALRATLVTTGVVTDQAKKTIRKEYEAMFKTKLTNPRGCENCYIDALDLIISNMGKGLMTMCAGAMVEFEGETYHRLNIIDSIAQKIIDSKPETAIYFYKK